MNVMPSDAFPRNLRRLREQREWSQYHLAELIGVTRAAIGQYEQGAAFPRVDKLERLAQVFGVSVPELIDEPRPKSTMTYAEVVLVANYRKLNDEGKAMLARQAEMMVASGLYNA